MTTKEFIEKAIEGGWRAKFTVNGLKMTSGNWEAHLMVAGQFSEAWFLDPLAWQAVGKIAGWPDKIWPHSDVPKGLPYKLPGYTWRMHRMVDTLCEGKTIEEFLNTL